MATRNRSQMRAISESFKINLDEFLKNPPPLLPGQSDMMSKLHVIWHINLPLATHAPPFLLSAVFLQHHS